MDVTFTMSASDTDGSIASWSLDVDNDGTAEYSGAGNPPATQAYTYVVDGTYIAKLTVTDDEGATAFDTVKIQVGSTETCVYNQNKGIWYPLIQSAHDAAASGDTLLVYANYTGHNESVTITKDHLTIKAVDPDVIVSPTDNSQNGFYLNDADGVTIEGFTIQNANHGIYLRSSSNNNITNCTAYNNSYYGIYLYSSSNNNTITNCTAYNNNKYGISLSSSSNNNITNCAVYNNSDYGIYLYSSSNNNQITNCNVYNNHYGILLYYSSNNNQITNCNVYNNHYGISLYSSSNNNQITNCTAYNNSYYGIWLYKSSNNNITNCAAYNNSYYGIYLRSSSNNNITNCNVYNNSWYGIFLWASSNNNITNCTAYNNSHGIYLSSSSNNNTISKNTANSNYLQGISIDSSKNNVISNNVVNGTTANVAYSSGIYLYKSESNKILDNLVTSNTRDGIYLYSSCNYNTLTNNTASWNGKAPSTTGSGIRLGFASNNTIDKNTANSNTQNGIYLQQDSNDNKITKNQISNNKQIGVGVCKDTGDAAPKRNILSNNTITSNKRGILLYQSDGNTVANNTVTGNTLHGICLDSSPNNNLVYNNYFNNPTNYFVSGGSGNKWNTTKTLGKNIIGGPYLGGNYWSNYTGKDSDGDGLGDDDQNGAGAGKYGAGDYHPLVKPPVAVGWVDDVSLTGGPPAPGTVQNPGFEDGSGNSQPHWGLLAYYGSGNTTTDTAIYHGGSKSIRFINYDTAVTTFVVQGGTGGSASDRIEVKPNQAYTLSAWVKSQPGLVGKFTLKVQYYNTAGNQISYDYKSFNGDTNGNWIQISWTFTTPGKEAGKPDDAKSIGITIEHKGV
ncbi:MAG: right-handed parallel beta-helix repeat-containing protein [Candidatus Methanoperedens sp.]|nr:right-handed parallel beta-helix repeat-containing protein [Candidatus Methanoperedens sp.]